MNTNYAYYNEIDKNCIEWLKQAMLAGFIAPGFIDTRPIQEVSPDDLRGFTQHHFFAGIGGWSIALRLAGWEDNQPVWTGSCPCQPFSSAGRQKGKKDDRHLWPHWFRLIREYQPTTIFGEQVSNAITFGWLDEVADDLEGEGYAIGAAVLPACSVGAPHKRDRLWFVGDTQYNGQPATSQQGITGEDARQGEKRQECAIQFTGASDTLDMANTSEQGLEGHRQSGQINAAQGRQDASRHFAEDGLAWIDCPDGKQRPVESSLCLLADGIPSKLRKAALHGFGNAIVPQVAANFITAYMEVIDEG